MYHGVGALQTSRHGGLVGEIAASEPHPARQDGTLLPGGEVVEHGDVVGAVCRQMLYEIGADEAGSARYEYAHASTSLVKYLSGPCAAIAVTTSRCKESLNGRNYLRTSWRCP